jgi:hypothetical protein
MAHQRRCDRGGGYAVTSRRPFPSAAQTDRMHGFVPSGVVMEHSTVNILPHATSIVPAIGFVD